MNRWEWLQSEQLSELKRNIIVLNFVYWQVFIEPNYDFSNDNIAIDILVNIYTKVVLVTLFNRYVAEKNTHNILGYILKLDSWRSKKHRGLRVGSPNPQPTL